jgi:hypothetical protein
MDLKLIDNLSNISNKVILLVVFMYKHTCSLSVKTSYIFFINANLQSIYSEMSFVIILYLVLSSILYLFIYSK